jgi:MFS family permease
MFDLSTLGWLMTAGGIGGLIGALLMAIWGGPNKHVYGVLGFTILSGVSILLCGLSESPWWIGVAAFAFSFSVPLVTSCSQVIWQKSIPKEMQGRVFSFRTVISTSFMPLGLVASPFLAEYVFEPLMVQGTPFSQVVGPYIGTGPGRGMAILFIFMGVMIMLVAILSFLSANLRSLGSIQKSDPSKEEQTSSSEATLDEVMEDKSLVQSTVAQPKSNDKITEK